MTDDEDLVIGALAHPTYQIPSDVWLTVVKQLVAMVESVRAEATLAERERLTGFKDDKLKELQDLRFECENLRKRLGMYECARTA